MNLDRKDIEPASSFKEIDVAGLATEELLIEARYLEVLDGPSASPYGVLMVKMHGEADFKAMSYLYPGWEHDGRFVAIKRTGSTVTQIRVWA